MSKNRVFIVENHPEGPEGSPLIFTEGDVDLYVIDFACGLEEMLYKWGDHPPPPEVKAVFETCEAGYMGDGSPADIMAHEQVRGKLQ